jgi:hypothetical protein
VIALDVAGAMLSTCSEKPEPDTFRFVSTASERFVIVMTGELEHPATPIVPATSQELSDAAG